MVTFGTSYKPVFVNCLREPCPLVGQGGGYEVVSNEYTLNDDSLSRRNVDIEHIYNHNRNACLDIADTLAPTYNSNLKHVHKVLKFQHR